MKSELTASFTIAISDINKIINKLAKETINNSDTYENAIKSVRQLNWDLSGRLREEIINEVISEINLIALKKATD